MLRCAMRLGRCLLSSTPITAVARSEATIFSWQDQLSSRNVSHFLGLGRMTVFMSTTTDKLSADDSFGIATGPEREELEAQQKGTKRFDLDPPRGPFGVKEAPALVQSHFNERIVGCSGGEGEDEHDVVWFKLKKGELYECPVCTQVFQLDVVGDGGKPGGHHH